MRHCGRCGTDKPVTAFARHAWCRECQREYNRARAQDASKHAHDMAAAAAWRQENPDYQRAWREANPERVRAIDARWRERNPDARKAATARWRENNPEKVRQWPSRSPERRLVFERNYAEANRPKIREKCRRRAARIRGATVASFTAAQLEERMSVFGNKCWMCGDDATQVDHVKPIAKGGAHMLANLRPACKSCNSSKGATWPVPTTRLQVA